MKKSTIILVIVLVAVVFGGAGYWFGTKKTEDKTTTATPTVTATTSTVASATTTADPTASWKTYTNSAYGYSYKYPTDLTIIDWTSAIKKGAEEANKDLLSVVGIGKNSNFTDYEFSSTVTNDSLDRRKLLACYELVSDKTETPINFAGLTAYKITCKAGGPSDMAPDVKTKGGEQVVRIIFQKGNYVYELGYDQSDLSKDTSQTFNQIASTFQFTK